MNTLNAEIKAKRELMDETLEYLARIARELEGLTLLRDQRAEERAKLKARRPKGKRARLKAG